MHLTVYLPAPARRLLEAEQLADEGALVPSGVASPNAWVSRLTVAALLSNDTVARLVLTILGEAKAPMTEAAICSAVVERQGSRRRLTPERAALVVNGVLRALVGEARTWEPLVEIVAGKDGLPAYRAVNVPD